LEEPGANYGEQVKRTSYLSRDGHDRKIRARRQRRDIGKYSCVYKGKGRVTTYRPGVAQRVGRGISLLFQDLGTSRG
jgi:hypothetical protein